MGYWFSKMDIEGTENSKKNINYYFNKESTTVIPVKFYLNENSYPWGLTVKSDDFEEYIFTIGIFYVTSIPMISHPCF